jgi:hypothetical protein
MSNHRNFFRSKNAKTRQICEKSRQNSAETRQIPSQLQKQNAAIINLLPIQAHSKPLPKRNSAKLKKKLQKQISNSKVFLQTDL